MVRWTVERADHGYELEAPSVWYWARAGVGFTIGAGGVYVLATAVWWWLLAHVPNLLLLERTLYP